MMASACPERRRPPSSERARPMPRQPAASSSGITAGPTNPVAPVSKARVTTAMWRDNDVRVYGEGIKRLQHATLGAIELEHSGFAVDGRSDLGMIVYNSVDPADADRIRSLLR